MKPSPRRPRAPYISGRPTPKARPTKTGATRIELISIGSELLRGRIHDENARNVARYFAQRGAIIQRITTVDDHERSISRAFRDALDRNPHLVISTGGLAPLFEQAHRFSLELGRKALSLALGIDLDRLFD